MTLKIAGNRRVETERRLGQDRLGAPGRLSAQGSNDDRWMLKPEGGMGGGITAPRRLKCC